MNNLNEIKNAITKDLKELNTIYIDNIRNISKYEGTLKDFILINLIDINTPKGYFTYITQAEKFKNIQNILNANEKQELKEFIQNNINNIYTNIIDVLKEKNIDCQGKILSKTINAFAAYKQNYDIPINVFENINNIDVGEHKTIIPPFMSYGSDQVRSYIEKPVALCLVELLKNVKEEEGPMQWLLMNYYAPNMITYIVKHYADAIKSSKDKRTFQEKENEILNLVQKTRKLQYLNNTCEILDDVRLSDYNMYQNNVALCYNFDIDNDVLTDLGKIEVLKIKGFLKIAILLERKFPSISAKALSSLVEDWKSFADDNMNDKVDDKRQEKMKKYFFKEKMPLKTFQEHAIKSQDRLLFDFETLLASKIPKYTKVIKKETKNIDFDFEEIELPLHQQETLFITVNINNEQINEKNITKGELCEIINYQTYDTDYLIRMKKVKGSLILEMKIRYSFDYTINIKDFSNFLVENLMNNISKAKDDPRSLFAKTTEAIAQVRKNKLFAMLEDKQDSNNTVKKKI